MASLNTVNMKFSVSPQDVVKGELSIPKIIREDYISNLWITDTEPHTGVWVAPTGDTTQLVTGVNGQSGEVELTASQVGALPADTHIPSDVDYLSNTDIISIWNSYI